MCVLSECVCSQTVCVSTDPGGREEVEVEMLVALAQVSVSQKDTVLRQLAALLHVLDNDIHLRGLWGHSDIRYCPMQQTHTKHTFFFTHCSCVFCVCLCVCV